jgi:hypothetical protein
MVSINYVAKVNYVLHKFFSERNEHWRWQFLYTVLLTRRIWLKENTFRSQVSHFLKTSKYNCFYNFTCGGHTTDGRKFCVLVYYYTLSKKSTPSVFKLLTSLTFYVIFDHSFTIIKLVPHVACG